MNKFFYVWRIVGPLLKAAEGLGDYLLDKLEEYVENTDNKIDDYFLLPTIRGIRQACNIQDQEEKGKSNANADGK
jgi:hypothetical protein